MKTLIIILLSTITSYSQDRIKVSIGNNEIWLTCNSMTPSKGFEILRKSRNRKMLHYDNYLVINDKTYYRPGITVMRRNRAYIYSNGNFEKVRIN